MSTNTKDSRSLYLMFLACAFISFTPLEFIELLNFDLEINSLAIFPFSFKRHYSTNSSVAATQPVKLYRNADLHKLEILKENQGKAGGGGISLN